MHGACESQVIHLPLHSVRARSASVDGRKGVTADEQTIETLTSHQADSLSDCETIKSTYHKLCP